MSPPPIPNEVSALFAALEQIERDIDKGMEEIREIMTEREAVANYFKRPAIMTSPPVCNRAP